MSEPEDDVDGEVLRMVPTQDEGFGPVPESSDELAWLTHLVFDRRARLGRSGPLGPSRRLATEYLVHPSIDKPQLFIPADRRIAATALGRFNDGMSTRKRATQLLAQPAFRLGIGQRIRSERLWLTKAASEPADRGAGPGERASSEGSASGPDAGHRDLTHLLCDLAGVDEGSLAITIGPPRANRKPVAQLIDRSGTMHLVAKVGWNVETGRLVANEAWWLRRAGAKRGRRLMVPELVDHRPWRGSDLAIQSAVRPSRLPRVTATGGVHTDLVLDVASLDPSGIGHWPWGDVVRVIAERHRREHQHDLAELAESIGSELSRRRVPIGAWHGDLSPWNLMTRGALTSVIDWEFAADQVPLGWDVVNHHVQVGLELLGLEPADAFTRAVVHSQEQLKALEVPAELTVAVAHQLLLELVARSRRLDPLGESSMHPVAAAALSWVAGRNSIAI